MTNLSPAAKQICRDNYSNPCPRCPIRYACKSDKGRDQTGLDAWRERVNAAAVKVGAEQ